MINCQHMQEGIAYYNAVLDELEAAGVLNGLWSSMTVNYDNTSAGGAAFDGYFLHTETTMGNLCAGLALIVQQLCCGHASLKQNSYTERQSYAEKHKTNMK